jgi:hypothetical protein
MHDIPLTFRFFASPGFCISCGAGNLARGRLLGGFFGRRDTSMPSKSWFEVGCGALLEAAQPFWFAAPPRSNIGEKS